MRWARYKIRWVVSANPVGAVRVAQTHRSDSEIQASQDRLRKAVRVGREVPEGEDLAAQEVLAEEDLAGEEEAAAVAGPANGVRRAGLRESTRLWGRSVCYASASTACTTVSTIPSAIRH